MPPPRLADSALQRRGLGTLLRRQGDNTPCFVSLSCLQIILREEFQMCVLTCQIVSHISDEIGRVQGGMAIDPHFIWEIWLPIR